MAGKLKKIAKGKRKVFAAAAAKMQAEGKLWKSKGGKRVKSAGHVKKSASSRKKSSKVNLAKVQKRKDHKGVSLFKKATEGKRALPEIDVITIKNRFRAGGGSESKKNISEFKKAVSDYKAVKGQRQKGKKIKISDKRRYGLRPDAAVGTFPYSD